MNRIIRVLGTGGTIAGTAAPGAADNAYQAAQLAVEDLVQPLTAELPGGVSAVQALQIAQLDSRDMSHLVWQSLAAALREGRQSGVVGQVVTHGTDTLEETAVFLHRVVGDGSPVVLTAAMRPATSPHADGPEHLRQALHLAADARARGILMAFSGMAWPAVRVRKLHPFALQAFSAGDGQPVARWNGKGWEWQDSPDAAAPLQAAAPFTMPADIRDWPRVEIVHSHAGASGEVVRALLKPVDATPPVRGLVISATGNGSIHHAIHQVLEEAVSEGRLARRDILVATRCIGGWVVGDPPQGWPVAAELTPAQARVALMLDMASR